MEREAIFLLVHRLAADEVIGMFLVVHRSSVQLKVASMSDVRDCALQFGQHLAHAKPNRLQELLSSVDDWTVWNINLFVAEYKLVQELAVLNKKGIAPSLQMMIRIYGEVWPDESKGHRFHAVFASLLSDSEDQKCWRQHLQRRWSFLFRKLTVRGTDTDDDTRGKVHFEKV